SRQLSKGASEARSGPARGRGGSLFLPQVPAAGEIPGKGGAREAAGVPRVGILGTRRAGVRRSRRAIIHPGTGSGSAWSESHGAHIYGRPFRRFLVQGAVPGGIRESADFTESRGWIAAAECLHCRRRALCAACQQTTAARNFDLPWLSAA